jgi:hypothetical protein
MESMISLDNIKEYIKFRGGNFVLDSQDAIEFAMTEFGEVMDARIRERSGDYYLRNNPDKGHNIPFEYGDLYMMLQCASYLDTGKSLEQNLLDKWESKGFKPEHL